MSSSRPLALAIASRARSASSYSLARETPSSMSATRDSSLRKDSNFFLSPAALELMDFALSESFQNSGAPIASSSVLISFSRVGTSKIPPEFRQAAFQASRVERQEVSGRK